MLPLKRERDAVPVRFDAAGAIAVVDRDRDPAVTMTVAEPHFGPAAAQVFGLGVVAEAVRGERVALPDGWVARALNALLVDWRTDVPLVAGWGRRGLSSRRLPDEEAGRRHGREHGHCHPDLCSPNPPEHRPRSSLL